ncbi:hypothetical protein [Arthrobacter sp. MYb213]|uniref:hypothetical protein n=1 Tax=Arthrobacter sp. MYb213 TaxID=1848595 RepID=UPI000CFA8B78|nr:hypothetical protein [Arthrobacter sp. MYb213]PRB69505.1 hypothetical protein CQ011_12140 [Arthrobacter sp. MYb213]
MTEQPNVRPLDYTGAPQRLDPVRDMEPIRMGQICYDHRGLHVEMNVANKSKKAYGQIVFTSHHDNVTKIGVRWHGQYEERSAHPDQIIRIEVTA